MANTCVKNIYIYAIKVYMLLVVYKKLPSRTRE